MRGIIIYKGNDRLNTAIYLRKSRAEENADPIETLARHKKILLEYAQKNRLFIAKIYVEGVMSGDSLSARPQMQSLLNDVSMGEYEAVLCMDIDRLGRGDMQDQGLIINTFKYSETLIITPDKTYNLNDDTDEELTEFKTFFARRELKTITRRLQRGLKQTIREGGYVANAPYGYKKVYKNKKPTLEIVEDEAYFVKMMYQMYVDGNGAQVISDELNRLGAKPRRSDKFNRNSVRHILKNPTFCGKIVWDRYKYLRKGKRNNEKNMRFYNDEKNWIIVDGLHDPIVSEEIFNRAQQIRKSKSIPSKTRGTMKLTNPLAGLIICGNCGHKMQRRVIKGTTYLLCNKAGCCKMSLFSDVENQILETLSEFLKNFVVNCKVTKTQTLKAAESQLRKSTSEINNLVKQKNSLHDLLEQGVYDIDTFKERQKIINNKLDETSDLIKSLNVQISKLSFSNADNLKASIETLITIYSTSTARQKNLLYKQIIQKVIYTRQSLKSDFNIEVFLNI